MADADYTFTQARARLEDIVTQVRKKDVSLEHSLDLLEEGVRLANACTEQIDQSEWRSVVDELHDEPAEEASDASRTQAAAATDSAEHEAESGHASQADLDEPASDLEDPRDAEANAGQ